VQIFASMLFFMLLMIMDIAAYSKEMINWAEKLLKDRQILIKKAWVALIVWAALIIWVIYTLVTTY